MSQDVVALNVSAPVLALVTVPGYQYPSLRLATTFELVFMTAVGNLSFSHKSNNSLRYTVQLITVIELDVVQGDIWRIINFDNYSWTPPLVQSFIVYNNSLLQLKTRVAVTKQNNACRQAERGICIIQLTGSSRYSYSVCSCQAATGILAWQAGSTH